MTACFEHVPGDARISSVDMRVIATISMPRAVECFVRIEPSAVVYPCPFSKFADIMKKGRYGYSRRLVDQSHME